MRSHGHYDWEPVAVRELRKFESVVLRKGLKEEILDGKETPQSFNRQPRLISRFRRLQIFKSSVPKRGNISYEEFLTVEQSSCMDLLERARPLLSNRLPKSLK